MEKKWLWHLEDPDKDNKGWYRVELYATDAMFALQTDPKHWSAEKPDDAAEVASEEPQTETEPQTGEHE